MRIGKPLKQLFAACVTGTSCRLLFFIMGILILNRGSILGKDSPDRDLIYEHSNIYLLAQPGFSPKPRITAFDNPFGYSVSLGGVMNFNAGCVYVYNFDRRFGLSTGLQLMLLSFKTLKYQYTIPQYIQDALQFTEMPCLKCSLRINHQLSIPIHFIYRHPLASRIDMEVSAGIDLKLEPGFFYEAYQSGVSRAGDTMINAFRITLENNANRNFRVLPYLYLAAGINQLLRNQHYLNYKVSANIALLNPYTRGNFYVLPGTAYAAQGTYKLCPAYVGLEVNYVFTFARRKTRKASYFQKLPDAGNPLNP